MGDLLGSVIGSVYMKTRGHLSSQLMDFLGVIDKHTKNLPQLNVLTIVLTE